MPKRCVPIYLEELKFAITRCGWKVTKLYNHYYFEQERYKRDFILRNQKFTQEAERKIESDFWKLLNNSNFGYDCRNNIDNCYFQPIKDEMNELSFIRRYYNNSFDKDISQFITSRILEDEITRKFNDERQELTEDDQFFSVKMRSLENRRKCEQEAVDKFKQKEKKIHKKIFLNSLTDAMEKANENEKIKTIMDFSDNDTASIKALAIKKNDKSKNNNTVYY